jgi:hypothetical protein
MKDRLFLSLLAAAAVLMIGFAAIWPQGYGARSWGPFGYTPLQQTPEMQAAMARQSAAMARKRGGATTPAAAAGLRSAP